MFFLVSYFYIFIFSISYSGPAEKGNKEHFKWYSKMRLSRQFQACLFFLQKDLECTKMQINQNQPTKTKISKQKTTKATVFLHFKEGKNCWCFLYAQNLFVKKSKHA